MRNSIRIRQWVSTGGDSDHCPVLLEVDLAQGKLASPFKMNPEWLKEEDFVNKIKRVWEPFDDSLTESVALQFN